MRDGGLVLPDEVRAFFRKRRRGLRRLLWLTYEFQPEALERWFGDLASEGVQIDVVAGVAPGGGRQSPRRGGIRLWRANWRGTFHPKLALLLADAEVVAGLGSANLTRPGLSQNLEAWRFLSREEGSGGLAGVRRFLEGLLREGVLSRSMGAEEYLEALGGVGAADGSVTDTLSGDLVTWAAKRIPRTCQELEVVSPVNADPTAVIGTLRKAFGVSTVRLFTGAEGRGLPAIPGVDTVHVLDTTEAEDAEGEGMVRIPTVHAKLYAFRKGGTVHLVWGSANLSMAAWEGRGKGRNLELVAHAVTDLRSWQRFRDGVRAGHRWVKVPPAPKGTFPRPEREPGGWALLQGVWDGRRLTLEANDTESGKGAARPLMLALRAPGGRRSARLRLRFMGGEAQVPDRFLPLLGLGGGEPPPVLEWCHARGAWAPIPLNSLVGIAGDGAVRGALDDLYLAYAGKELPGAGRPGSLHAVPPDEGDGERDGEGMDEEERELTHCDYLGELDNLALRVRMVARRLAASCGGNKGLWEIRRREALRRVDEEETRTPGSWSGSRRAFFEKELERAWRG